MRLSRSPYRVGVPGVEGYPAATIRFVFIGGEIRGTGHATLNVTKHARLTSFRLFHKDDEENSLEILCDNPQWVNPGDVIIMDFKLTGRFQ